MDQEIEQSEEQSEILEEENLESEENAEESELREEEPEALELTEESDLEDESLEDPESFYDEENVEMSGEDYEDDFSIDSGEEGPEDSEPVNFDPPINCSLALPARIEAIIFAAPKCMKIVDIIEVLGEGAFSEEEVKQAIEELVDQYEQREGGFRLESVRGHGYQFRTVQEAAPYMEKLFSSRPRPLSRAALETLSIVAYRQPVSRADIEFIRGVDSGSIVKNLLERSLIKCVGRNEEVAGRPMIFGTTDDFLAVFRLESLKDLPPISSFQPPQDMLQSAEEQMEDGQIEDGPEEGDFVGVEGEDSPMVSEGLVENDDEELLDAGEEESSETSEESSEALEVEGATAAISDDLSFEEEDSEAPSEEDETELAAGEEGPDKESSDSTLVGEDVENDTLDHS